MRPLIEAAASTFQSVRFVLTDMDETLTYQGVLPQGPMRRWNGCKKPE